MRHPLLSSADLDRRRFLKTSLAGSAALLVASALPCGCGGREPVPRGLLALSPVEYRTMEAAAARLIPPGGPFAPGAADVDVARRVDRIVAQLDDETRLRVKHAIRLFEYAPFLSGHLRSFRKLSPGAQDEVLHAWNSSRRPFRVHVFDLLKSLALMAFYNSSEVHDAMGKAPPLCHARRVRGVHPGTAAALRGGR
ncbi:MAG: hypothetical protein A2Y95_05580 [Deltaproteobacteria bacterium RBG_13_65_10]|jgi:hypothetical protein|nr:MAG: hypothetical protein A2Y95_05580 [Deltaproteobacteria bacterium RBG_13_65_10]